MSGVKTKAKKEASKQGRWHRTKHTGIYSDKAGNLQVRAAIKRNGKVLTNKRVLAAPVELGDALLVYAELKAELEGGRRPTQQTTYSDFAERWIVRCSTINRPMVVKTNSNHLAFHILPHIGHLFIEDLTRKQIIEMTKDWVAKRKDDGTLYSKATVHGWWRAAKALIADACAEFQVPFNPTERVRLQPMKDRIRKREHQTLSPQQMVALMDFVQQFLPRRYAEVVTLVLGGFRPSEMYALTWSDIDFVRQVIRVTKSVDRGHLEERPKTERSDRNDGDASREVVLPERAFLALKEHRKSQLANLPRSRVPGLVFPSSVGSYCQSSTLRKVYKAAEGYLDLDLNLGNQVLRRTYNTVLADCTDNITRQALMGHSDDAMTKLYDSVPLERKTKAVARLDAILKGVA